MVSRGKVELSDDNLDQMIKDRPMNFEHLPVRIKKLIRGHIFQLTHLGSVNFASAPLIEGYWPKIDNQGSSITFGQRCIFRSIRLRHYISAARDTSLQVGDYVFMNDGTNICVTTSIKIGNFVRMGEMVYIYDTDYHSVSPGWPVKQAPVVIGDNVWLGAGSIILAGSNIGDHAVIGAGSVVCGHVHVPTCSVAAGAPARVVKTFDAPDGWVRA